MLIFWNLPKMLLPKIWPQEGQSKKIKILSEDKKSFSKITTFCENKQKFTSLVYFLAFEGHLSQKRQKKSKQSNFWFVL